MLRPTKRNDKHPTWEFLASWHEGLLALYAVELLFTQCSQITTGEKQAASLLLSSQREEEEAIKMPHLPISRGSLSIFANLKPKKAASYARALSAVGPPLPRRQYLTGSHVQNSVHDARGIPTGHNGINTILWNAQSNLVRSLIVLRDQRLFASWTRRERRV